MKFELLVTAALTVLPLVQAVPVELTAYLSNQWPANGQSPKDQDIIDQTLHTLNTIYKNLTSTTLDTCTKCKSSLEIGKSIALTRPDLVSPIFTKWCIDNKILSKKNCIAAYSRNTVKSSFTGTDFANILQLMDPWSLDGDYFCYYKVNKECDLPKLPKVDLSGWWPEKPANATKKVASGETFNVLHVSDFHVVLDYQQGSEANCTNGMCCVSHFQNALPKPDGIDNSHLKFYDSFYDEDEVFHKGDDITSQVYNESVWVPAQSFGNYHCDSPKVLINSTLKSIVNYTEQNNMKFDFVIFTGDIIDHDELVYTDYNMTVEAQEYMFKDLKKYFKDTPVYSVLGNHDTFPYAQISSKASGFTNLYEWNQDLMADLWVGNGWLPTDSYEDIKTHYTGFSIKTARNLKVIAINSNIYYQKNYYTYWNMTENYDTFDFFKFLIEELVESEKIGQKVWLMAHIPWIDYDTLPIQAEVYKQIVTRFQDTIAGIFFGHTHKDQFNVMYANDNKTIENAILNSWTIQSVTPLSNYNPGWRYYKVDTESAEVMDSYNFYTQLNTTLENSGQEPVWEFEYSARDAYDPAGKWPKDGPLNATFWATVAEDIKTNITVAQDYADFLFRKSPYVPDCSKGKCDKLYCYVSSFNVNNFNNCTEKIDYKKH